MAGGKSCLRWSQVHLEVAASEVRAGVGLLGSDMSAVSLGMGVGSWPRESGWMRGYGVDAVGFCMVGGKGRAGCFASIESVFFLSSVPGLDVVSGDKERMPGTERSYGYEPAHGFGCGQTLDTDRLSDVDRHFVYVPRLLDVDRHFGYGLWMWTDIWLASCFASLSLFVSSLCFCVVILRL